MSKAFEIIRKRLEDKTAAFLFLFFEVPKILQNLVFETIEIKSPIMQRREVSKKREILHQKQ